MDTKKIKMYFDAASIIFGDGHEAEKFLDENSHKLDESITSKFDAQRQIWRVVNAELTNEQRHLIRDLKHMDNVDFVPSELPVYETLPLPWAILFRRAIAERIKMFNVWHEQRKRSFE